ncbi:MAG: hypothetical protein KKE73_04555 [Proteobacteria bacterium]|nr:hypothetical protein [Pseudomonadota bacterium]
MKNTLIALTIAALLTIAGSAFAMEDMTHGSTTDGDAYKHAAMVDGIHAEFQVMDLASMNMSDPEGKTHHVMAMFMKDNKMIEKAVGKIKLIAPSGKEQVQTLKDFGGGNFAANFSFDEPGKWGVICLFKDDAGKHIVKFWYDHK